MQLRKNELTIRLRTLSSDIKKRLNYGYSFSICRIMS